MKKNLFIFLFLFIAVEAHGMLETKAWQDSIFKVLTERTTTGNWARPSENQLLWCLSDSFTMHNRVSSIRKRPQWDTLEICLTFVEGWTRERVQETVSNNRSIADPLITRATRVLDSLEWKGFKTNPAMFNNDPFDVLKHCYHDLGITYEEIKTLNNLVRVPDFMENNCGIFLDCNPNYEKRYIAEERVASIYTEMLNFISRELFALADTRQGQPVYLEQNQ